MLHPFIMLNILHFYMILRNQLVKRRCYLPIVVYLDCLLPNQVRTTHACFATGQLVSFDTTFLRWDLWSWWCCSPLCPLTAFWGSVFYFHYIYNLFSGKRYMKVLDWVVRQHWTKLKRPTVRWPSNTTQTKTKSQVRRINLGLFRRHMRLVHLGVNV